MEYCSLSDFRFPNSLQYSHDQGSIAFPIPCAVFSMMCNEPGFVSALQQEGFRSCLCERCLLDVVSCFVVQSPVCEHILSPQLFGLYFYTALCLFL